MRLYVVVVCVVLVVCGVVAGVVVERCLLLLFVVVGAAWCLSAVDVRCRPLLFAITAVRCCCCFPCVGDVRCLLFAVRRLWVVLGRCALIAAVCGCWLFVGVCRVFVVVG